MNKAYREANKEKFAAMRKKIRDRHPEKERAASREYGAAHRSEKQAYDTVYRQQQKDRIAAYKKEWEAKRLTTDPAFKVLRNLRRRLSHVLFGYSKAAPTMDMLGCSRADLVLHLESQFLEGMTWSNYGIGGWHIDHIVPCCLFDLSCNEEQRRCFHFTNLRPLWEKDNVSRKLNVRSREQIGVVV